jgi:hypothetical protein
VRTRPDLEPVHRPTNFPTHFGDLPTNDEPLVEHTGTGTVYLAAALLALGLLVVVLLVG